MKKLFLLLLIVSSFFILNCHTVLIKTGYIQTKTQKIELDHAFLTYYNSGDIKITNKFIDYVIYKGDILSINIDYYSDNGRKLPYIYP